MNRSVSKRVFRRLRAFLAALPVFLLLCSQANAESADRFYARAGGGVFFLELPESSPFIRTNGAEEAVAFLEHYDASYRGRAAGPSCGRRRIQGLRTQPFHRGGGFPHFSRLQARQRTQLVHRTVDGCVDCFHGHVLPRNITRGMSQFYTGQRAGAGAVDKSRSARSGRRLDRGDRWKGVEFRRAYFAWGDPIRITTERDVTFWGGGFVTGMSFGLEARRKVSLFVGPSFKKLRQAFDIFAYESNRDPNVNYMTLKEELKPHITAALSASVLTFRSKSAGSSRWTANWGDIILLPHMRDARERSCRRGIRWWTCPPIRNEAIRTSPCHSVFNRR